MESGLERAVREENFSELDSGAPMERNLYQKTKDAVIDYTVDVSGSLLFFNPLLATGEALVAGMDARQILVSRMVGSMVQALGMRFGGMLRNDVAENSNLTKDSPWYKKKAVSVLSTLAFQIPVYTTILCHPDMELSSEQAYRALAQGVAITLVSGYHYGKWQDIWRGFFGRKKAIE